MEKKRSIIHQFFQVIIIIKTYIIFANYIFCLGTAFASDDDDDIEGNLNI
jgi:hypothetical protein